MPQGVSDRAANADVGGSAEPIFGGDRLRMHDGIPPGGIGLARCGRRAVADANDAAVPADAFVGMTQLTATRTIALPAAASFAPGQALTVADESGACSANLLIIVSATGADTDPKLGKRLSGKPILPPASATSACPVGMVTDDARYVCVANNSWKWSALTRW